MFVVRCCYSFVRLIVGWCLMWLCVFTCRLLGCWWFCYVSCAARCLLPVACCFLFVNVYRSFVGVVVCCCLVMFVACCLWLLCVVFCFWLFAVCVLFVVVRLLCAASCLLSGDVAGCGLMIDSWLWPVCVVVVVCSSLFVVMLLLVGCCGVG